MNYIKDISIPVPWGTISGKVWGKESGLPLLAVHGIMDNSGSFDRLVSLLPNNFYCVCIDLPGHGESSHFPSGLPLEFMHHVFAVKFVVDFLKWDKCYFLGHSLGAQILSFFSGIYPERAIRLIMIDGLSPHLVSADQSAEHIRKYFDNLETSEATRNSKQPPSYTYNEALEKLKGGRALSDNAAKALIKRSLIKSGSGFRFSLDQRLKLYLRPIYTMEQIKNFIDSIKCPIFMIIAEETFLRPPVRELGKYYHQRFNTLFKNSQGFNFVIIPGNHDVHMNFPERLVPHICKFFLQDKCAL